MSPGMASGAVPAEGPAFCPSLPPRSSWNAELMLDMVPRRRTRRRPKDTEQGTRGPERLGAAARPAPLPHSSGETPQPGQPEGPARYSQSAVYSAWAGCTAAPSAAGGVGAGLSAWALRTSMARGWSGSTTFKGCRQREHSHTPLSVARRLSSSPAHSARAAGPSVHVPRAHTGSWLRVWRNQACGRLPSFS